MESLVQEHSGVCGFNPHLVGKALAGRLLPLGGERVGWVKWQMGKVITVRDKPQAEVVLPHQEHCGVGGLDSGADSSVI